MEDKRAMTDTRHDYLLTQLKDITDKVGSKKLLEAIDIFTSRRQSHPLEFYQPTAKQLPFHQSKKKIRLFIGSNQSGKTTAGAIEMLWYLTGTHPYLETPKPPINAWIVSLDHEEQRDTSQAKMLEYIPKSLIVAKPVIQRGIIDYIELSNGSKVTFKSADSAVEKFSGAVLHCVWIDEETPQDIFNEIYIRLLRHNALLWMTMTPINKKNKGLSWTFHTYYKPFLEGKNKDFDVFEAEIWDNPYIPIEKQIEEIKRLYTPDEYAARIRGKYTVLAGKMIFPSEVIQELLESGYDGKRGYFKENKFGEVQFEESEESDAFLEVFEPPMPDYDYVIGADVSEGLGALDVDKDYSVAVVLKRSPLKVVAIYRTNTEDENTFTESCHLLGRYYNNALLGVEDNGLGKVVNFLLYSGNEYLESYPNLYMREAFDEGIRQATSKVGWRTDVNTRPRMISGIYSVLRDRVIGIPSRTILEEMMMFKRDEKGKAQAQRGSFDDTIIALGIAIQMHQSLLEAPETEYGRDEEEKADWYTVVEADSPQKHFDRIWARKKKEHWLLQ